jgi:lipopolysaccharide heptosyltransferase II
MSEQTRISSLKNILIVTKNWLGDAVCITPAVASIRSAYPDAAITVLAHPRCAAVFTGHPAVARVFTFAERRGPAAPADLFSLWRKLVRGGYDAVFLFHRSRSKAVVAALAGIPHRIGYDTKGRGIFLTRRVPQPARQMHMIDYHLALLAACGIPPARRYPQFFMSAADRSRAREILAESGLRPQDRYAVINPGGNWDRKRWPAICFAQTADRVARERGVKIVITGGEKDGELARLIAGSMKTAPCIAAGRTTLKTLGAVLERALFYIGNDSGPTHIAAALRVPLVALFGPTSPELTGPAGAGRIVTVRKDVGCAVPCYAAVCPAPRCMEAVTVDDVCAQVGRILDGGTE